MKHYLKLSGILLLICIVASGTLALVNKKTKPIIDEIAAKEEKKAMLYVLPDAETFEKREAGDFEYFLGQKSDGELVGYVFIAAEQGYSSVVRTVVGLKTNFSVNSIKVISQAETPGLGANCEKREWQDLFKDKKIAQIAVIKDGGEITSITGSTITSRAISNSISAGIKHLEGAVVKEGGNK